MKNIYSLVFVFLFSVTLITGCTKGGSDDDNGGSGGNASGDNRIRFLHVIPEQDEVQVFINQEDQPRFTLRYGEMTPYLNLGRDRIELRLLADPSPVPIFEENFTVNTDTTMMFLGPRNLPTDIANDYRVSAKRFQDLHEPFVSNRFLLRVVNASPSTDRFDVFVLRPDTSISDNILARDKGVGFGSVTNYTEGNESLAYVLLVDSKDGTEIVRTETFNFNDNPVITLILLDSFGRTPPLQTIVSYDSDY